MDIRTALKTGIAELREAEVPSFTLAAELLLLHCIQRDRTWLYAHSEETIEAQQAEQFFTLIRRRAAGEPSQHLTGTQEFYGLEFSVSPDVLIPRPETEHVIEVALDRLALREIQNGRPQTISGEGLLIADIGTGSGCLAITLAKQLPGATLYAADISSAALEVARHNAERHAVADRIHFVLSNLFDGLRSQDCKRLSSGAEAPLSEPVMLGLKPQPPKETFAAQPISVGSHESQVTNHQSPLFDLIISNPPYVGRREAATLAREVRDHEPEPALYGGEEGYEFYAGLIAQSFEHLKPGGVLVLELGYNSLPAVQPLLDAPQWDKVGITNDLAGIPRIIAARRVQP